jgi:hypothetical protein
LLGVCGGIASIGACALDESGTSSDGGSTLDVVVNPDVTVDGGGPDVTGDVVVAQDADAEAQAQDVFVGGCDAGTTCAVTGAYTIVEYDPNGKPGCNAGYTTKSDLIEDPQAVNNTCTCACGSTTPTTNPTCKCTTATAAFDILFGNNCTNTVTAAELLADTTCYTTAQSLSGNADAIVAKPDAGCTASGGACGGNNINKNFTTTSTQTKRCDAPTTGASCNSGQGICVPTPSNGYSLCVTDGTPTFTCPSKFPNKHVVGTGLTDTRSCNCSGSCAINSVGTCGTPKLVLYGQNDNSCTTSGTTLTADGQNASCVNGFGTNPQFGSAKYSVPFNNNATCGYSGGQYVDGGVSLDNTAYVICCQ